jgi:hypothetical protein
VTADETDPLTDVGCVFAARKWTKGTQKSTDQFVEQERSFSPFTDAISMTRTLRNSVVQKGVPISLSQKVTADSEMNDPD